MTEKKKKSAPKAEEPVIAKIPPAVKGKALAKKTPARPKAKVKARPEPEESESLEDDGVQETQTKARGGKRGRNLVIVESPAKARTIGKYLGPGYEVRASNGHVRDLPKSKLGVDIENGFQPSYILIKGKAKILKELKQSARQASTIYLAPDPDREGEAIAWHLAETLGNGSDGRIRRLAFYEITKRGILSALETPRSIDMNKVHAQQARRVLDRLVGYQVSPFLWKTVRYGLSAGRVQSVALRLICEREDEVRAFVPREYWTLDADLATRKDEVFRARVQKKDGEKFALENEAQAREAAAELGKQSFQVTGVRTQEKKRNPLPPFITSTLQQESFQRLGFSAKKTMVVAQQLYEGIDIGAEGSTGLITYMRTDSTRTSPEALAEVREYIAHTYGANYLPAEARAFRSRETAQDAHEAIRPTSVARTPASMKHHLEHDQYRVYELIWQRFVASQMNPALVLTTTADITAGPFLLRASGSRVKFDGFTRAYSSTLIDTKAQSPAGADAVPEVENTKLPALAEGDALKQLAILPEQHFTTPPPRYTEASLVKMLEEKGIGRPSTYATIVSTILTRDYVERDRGKLTPTELGMTVWKLLAKMFGDVFEVEFTAKMEQTLDRVESGKDQWDQVVAAFYGPFKNDLTAAEAQRETLKASLAEESDKECPECGSKMVKRYGRNGPFLACPRYPECKTTMPIEEEAESAEVPTQPCPICESPMRIRSGRFGKFLACTRYPDCKGTRPLGLGVPCPECGTGELVERRTKRGKSFFGCGRYPACTFAVWDRPLKQPCPSCAYPILIQKRTKTKGDYLQCPKCKARVDEGSEAVSGSLDH